MYVADTHALVHHALARKTQLGKNAQRVLEKADAGNAVVYVPTVVLWEISRLAELGRIHLKQTFEHWCRALDSKPGFSIVSLEWLDIQEARRLPFADPFDCFIAGTAIRLDVPLITRDQAIVDSRLVRTVW